MTATTPATMRGFAMLTAGETGWIEKTVPICGPNDALLRPTVVAPCTTDIKTVWAGALGERHDMILGHECCAEVVAVGSEVRDYSVGDRVVVPAVTPNWGSCEAQAGNSPHGGGLLGSWSYSNTGDGMFSDLFLCPDADANLAHVPAGVSEEEAVMLSDMVPPGFRTVELAGVEFGDTVLVIGTGAVGLMAIAASYLRGASQVIAVGSRSAGVAAARGYGAVEVIDYHDETPIDVQVKRIVGEQGVDRVCVCGGGGVSLSTAARSVRPGGGIGSAISLAAEDAVTFTGLELGLGMGNKTITGGGMIGGRYSLERFGNLMSSGRLDVDPLISHRFNGWHGIEEAIAMTRSKPDDFIKSVVTL